MNLKQLNKAASEKLSSIYTEREILHFFRIIKEDLFDQYKIEDKLNSADIENYLRVIDGLMVKEPIQYLCGKVHFYGHVFTIDRRALIPRPETEELVHWVITDLKNIHKDLKIIDIGSGSGCITLSISKDLPQHECIGVDVSDKAIALAKKNAKVLKIKADFIIKNVLEDDQEFFSNAEVLVSNPPYILKSESSKMGESVIKYEPELALFVEGNDPLLFYKKILSFALTNNSKVQVIYFEISEFYKAELEAYLSKWPEFNSEFKKDMQGKWRMLKVGKSGIVEKQKSRKVE